MGGMSDTFRTLLVLTHTFMALPAVLAAARRKLHRRRLVAALQHSAHTVPPTAATPSYHFSVFF